MPKLIEDGFVYIAQPPLFKVKRGQREEYVETEQQMNNMMLELGREGLTLERGKQALTDNEFKQLLGYLDELDKIGKILEKKGVNTAQYISFWSPKSKKLPIYRTKVEGKDKFILSEAELEDLTEKEGKEVEQDLLELFEAKQILDIISKIEKLGLDFTTYSANVQPQGKDGDGKKAKAAYAIASEKEKKEFAYLKEVLAYVKEQATRGMHIQRYKGLGEMNPSQLWETTMDPEKRTMLKVALEDAAGADELFTVLMGDQVEPRRKFIEDYAHQVKNLDV
jgi:DNA gyrase subunit B